MKITKIIKPLTAITFWGASFVATKSLLDKLSPLGIIYIRMILGIIAAFSVATIRKRDFTLRKKDVKGIIILAVISIAHLWIQVTGMQYTSASNTGWIIGTIPVIMAVMGYIFYKEKMSKLQITGAVISFTGLIVLISKGDLSSISFISNLGDLLVFCSAFTWSIYSFYGKKVTLDYPPALTILYLFLAMFIFLSPLTLNKEFINSVINLNLINWGALLFLGFLCSGVAYILWAEAMNELPANRVGAFLYLEPFVTLFTAWIFLKEEISLLMILSGFVIIGGVILINRK